jgi:hypothetical protein
MMCQYAGQHAGRTRSRWHRASGSSPISPLTLSRSSIGIERARTIASGECSRLLRLLELFLHMPSRPAPSSRNCAVPDQMRILTRRDKSLARSLDCHPMRNGGKAFFFGPRMGCASCGRPLDTQVVDRSSGPCMNEAIRSPVATQTGAFQSILNLTSMISFTCSFLAVGEAMFGRQKRIVRGRSASDRF